MKKKFISIRFKTILQILGLFCAIVVISITTIYQFMYQRIQTIEFNQGIEQAQRINDSLDYVKESVVRTTEDWSKWDETYFFVDGTNPTYLDQNMNYESLETLGIDKVLVYSLDNDLLHDDAYDFINQTTQPVDSNFVTQIAEAGLLENVNNEETLSGYVSYEGQLSIIVAATITRSLDKEDSNGILVFIKMVDDDLVSSLKSIVGVTFSINQNDGLTADNLTKFTYLSSEILNVKSLLFDINNRHDLMLEFEIVLQSSIIVRTGMNIILAVLVAILTISLLIILFVLDKQVFKRISRLTQNINEIDVNDTFILRLSDDPGNDEIGIISVEFNKLLGKLESSFENISRLAHLDYMTGIHNRLSFYQEVEQRFATPNDGFAIFFLDLDEFKQINDVHGHDVGDMVIYTVAQRLQQEVLNVGIVARSGGDEFLLCVDITNKDELHHFASKIIKAIKEPIDDGKIHLLITATCGMAIYPDNGRSVNELIKYADRDMYRQKAKKGVR